MTEYDVKARIFLQDFNLKIDLKEGGNRKPCEWECGNSYLVTIKRGRKRMSFDFHDSIHNKRMGLKPSNYSILSTLGSEQNCPETLEDFLDEFGYDYREGKDCFKKLKTFSNKIKKFFTEEELDRLWDMG